jgi:DNA-3-methyladenine glycosylase I
MSDEERCGWVGTDQVYMDYHDTEWGIPEYDSRALWEKLILDGFQAGLSWITILKKRDDFRTTFANFGPHIVADWGEKAVLTLFQNSGIIRHKGKIEASITNAQAWQRIEADIGFDTFLWNYVGGKPQINSWEKLDEIPAQTPLSVQISKDLKKAGFKFCGPTIVYAFMEAADMVNDHLSTCPCHKRVSKDLN